MSQKRTPGAPPVTMDDSRRLDTLANSVKSCISPADANKNILPSWDTSHCSRETWENTPKCYRIVTLDSADQSASITIPLQESAVGFDSLSIPGAQPPKLFFGGFFCALLAWQLQMVAGQGHLRVRRYLVSGLSTLSGPPPRLTAGMAANQMQARSPAMLKPSQGMSVPCFPRLFDSTDHVLCLNPAPGGVRCP